MAVYQIIKKGDPILREKARPVPKITPNIEKLLDNLADTMYAAEGAGLAAPQIGISKKVIVVDIGEGIFELINPEIISASGNEEDTEGCLSIPGLQGRVHRATEVTVIGLDRQGQEIKITAHGLFARALQHEIDHLDGILFIDKVTEFID
ncbi:peptide deformylase [Metallumcola ferriviriculae]|uniref:Peptide deformylase n=1 Tax=Metallumcola ferriviriculae TaxID=3039180 RepID=A0AAU0UPM6_9FIRM|nr:peptide deformylase [Desulfitibacteraceae bacterium MK1]